MSRRAVKRFEQQIQNAAEADAKDSGGENDEGDGHSIEDLRPSPAQDAKKSIFALLEVEDSDHASSSSDKALSEKLVDDKEEGVCDVSGSGEPQELGECNIVPETIPSVSNAEAPIPKKGKKKRKKRKNRKRNEQVDRENDPDWIALNEASAEASSAAVCSSTSTIIPSGLFGSDDDDDVRDEAQRIMTMIRDMAFPDSNVPGSSAVPMMSGTATAFNAALLVEPRLLNADSELKRLFGARVVESERRGEDAAPSRRRAARPARAALRRKVTLVTPRETWMDHAPGLMMQLDTAGTEGAGAGVKLFKYVYDASYQQVQEQYRMVVNTLDPNQLVALSAQFPFHVDTLLQLGELYRQMGELDRAAEMVERALCALESSWSMAFKPFDGSCRLSFDVAENRSLYVALIRYSQLLTRRGLHRTALEISKLLLNLDPEKDPMGVLLVADSYALLSGEFEWVGEMMRGYEYMAVEYFPNFAASVALAAEFERARRKESSSGGGSSRGQGTKKDGDENEDENEAEELLVTAILTFPMIVEPLLKAMDDSSSVLLESRLFEESWYSGGGHADMRVLTRIARVYAERGKLLWNSAECKGLLVRSARRAGKLDQAAGMGMDEETGRLNSTRVSDEQEHERVARCRRRRFEAAKWLEQRGLYRQLQIGDFAEGNGNGNGIVEAMGQGQAGATDAADVEIAPPPRREVTVARGALEFLQSMLPWREARDAREDAP